MVDGYPLERNFQEFFDLHKFWLSGPTKLGDMTSFIGFSRQYSMYWAAGSLALVTHVGLQIVEPKAMTDVGFYILANCALIYTLGTTVSRWEEFVKLILGLNVTFLSILALSIVIYRLFFHRTRKYPGPFWAKITRFWAVSKFREGEYHRAVRKLHEKYGDIVRVGPNELDICSIEAPPEVLGGRSRCRKGPWYEGNLIRGDIRMIQNTVEPEAHRWKRRIWDKGFSPRALKDLEPRVHHFANLLVEELRQRKERVDLSSYFAFFAFDMMGELAFGEPYGMVKSGVMHPYVGVVHKSMVYTSLISCIPWMSSIASLSAISFLQPIFSMIPIFKDGQMLMNLSADMFRRRLAKEKTEVSRKDVFSFLLGEDTETGTKYSEGELLQESRNLILGGSDTTSAALAHVFFYLVHDQTRYKILQKELGEHNGSVENNDLMKLPYLNAVINEGLRLMPPVASGVMSRKTPPEGILIGGQYIPGNTVVGIGAMELGRDKRYWDEPDTFMPERWLSDYKGTSKKTAYIPFSIGPYNCVGKHLALMELRIVVSTLVRAFDMEFCNDFVPENFENSVKDTVTSTLSFIPVKLALRDYIVIA